MENSKIKWSVLAACAMLSFLLATGGVAGDDREPPANRIIGGNEADPGEFPFIAALTVTQPGFTVKCGCSIIDKWHVLTAAHCVTNEFTSKPFNPRHLEVKVGCHLRTECSSTHNVARVLVHHAWNSKLIGNGYDIAVLKLEEEIEFNSLSGYGAVGSIDLAPSGDLCCNESDEKLTAIGWGRTKAGVSHDIPLMKVELDSNPQKNCSTSSGIIRNNDKLICTQTSGRNTCKGDSGGPLVRKSPWGNSVLVGITSFGDPECGPEEGDLFTKVSAFRDWIDQCTNDGTCQAL